MVEFELLDEPKRVCAFYNMGTNRERPHAGQQSRYFKAWCIANGERPQAQQKLDPDVFLESQVFNIEVADCGADSEGKQKDDSLVYSRVTSVLSADRANHHNHPIRQSAQSTDSVNHESVIMQSPNQESTHQGGREKLRQEIYPSERSDEKRGSGRSARSTERFSKITKASPQPGDGNANPKQTRRAGASAPAQAGTGMLIG